VSHAAELRCHAVRQLLARHAALPGLHGRVTQQRWSGEAARVCETRPRVQSALRLSLCQQRALGRDDGQGVHPVTLKCLQVLPQLLASTSERRTFRLQRRSLRCDAPGAHRPVNTRVARRQAQVPAGQAAARTAPPHQAVGGGAAGGATGACCTAPPKSWADSAAQSSSASSPLLLSCSAGANASVCSSCCSAGASRMRTNRAAFSGLTGVAPVSSPQRQSVHSVSMTLGPCTTPCSSR
jgi:hypothetical protein